MLSTERANQVNWNFFGSPWMRCINYFWSTKSWFSHWKTISDLYVFFLGPLHISFMSGNGKYWEAVNYSIRVLSFGSPWMRCINYFRSTKSWFSRWKIISNLYIFFSGPLCISFMSGNDKHWGAINYSIGVQFFGSPWMRCKNYFWSTKSWFSRWKT